MKGIIDRLEGDYVVIEIEGQTKDIPRSQMDPEVKAGDVVRFRNGKWQTDARATARREDQIKKRMDDVWED